MSRIKTLNPARLIAVLYWLTPVVLFVVQLHFSMSAMTQLRYEEDAESIRNVYWLSQHEIYDGISSNVGFYGLLMLAYKAFGFSIYMAKYVRAGLWLISLLCMAEVLRRAMGAARAIVPLIAIGLSPTILYFNAIQTSYGIDLQYFPICLLIAMALPLNRYSGMIMSVLLGAISMIACMSYPTFIFYLPVLAGVFAFRIHREKPGYKISVGHLACMAIGFVMPFAFALAWLNRPMMLLNDPVTRSGIFRGGGNTGLYAIGFWASLKMTLSDLFVTGWSYHFELPRAEFAGAAGRIGFAAAAIASVAAFARVRRFRFALALAWGLIAIGLIAPSLGTGSAGLRRCTAALAGFYAIFAMAWAWLTEGRLKSPSLAWIGIALLVLLPLHSIASLRENREAIARPGAATDRLWFDIRGTPEKSVEYLLEQTRQGKPVVIRDKQGRVYTYPYVKIYSMLQSWRLFNQEPEVPIYAIDPKTSEMIKLEMKLWDTYYWPHE